VLETRDAKHMLRRGRLLALALIRIGELLEHRRRATGFINQAEELEPCHHVALDASRHAHEDRLVDHVGQSFRHPIQNRVLEGTPPDIHGGQVVVLSLRHVSLQCPKWL